MVGMPKCGSSDVYSKLTWHPEVTGMKEKENHWWTRERLGKWARTDRSGHEIMNGQTPTYFRNYLDLMNTSSVKIEENEGMISVDGSPSLLFDMLFWESRFPGMIEPPFTNADLIHDVTPRAKIILTLRNPVERLYSDYRYFANGEVRSPAMFHEEAVTEVGRFKQCLEGSTLRRCCYAVDNDPSLRLNIGVYYCFVKDWYKLFELHVVRLEEYSYQSVPVLLSLYSWLELSQPNVTELERYVKSSEVENINPAEEAMYDETRLLLEEFYGPYNKLLADLLGDTNFLY